MIDEHKDSKCRIFFCYRAEGSETAKYMKSYLRSVRDKDYGRIWYSDDENVGNYTMDIPVLIGQADIFVIFLAPRFTDYFLTPDGNANLYGYDHNPPCITALEICEIEKQRQSRPVRILTVNIDQYSFSEQDLSVLKCVFKDAGILREDSIDFYRNLNRNVYLRRQTDFASFSDRIMSGLEDQSIITKKQEFDDAELNPKLTIIDEASYRTYFQSLITEAKYPIVKFFGYTGEVLSADLLTYIARYSLNMELRILQRNYVIEELDEKAHNAKIPAGLRPWDKAKAIKQACFESWNYSLKRTIRYYSHQPILKGCLFCNANGRADIGFVNFQKWEPLPSAGGSVFKSVPSDMIMINPCGEKHCEVLLERLNSQFEYEWTHALSADEMKEYKHMKTEVTKAKVLIMDFDRTLVYLYRNTALLTDLAKIICDYYRQHLDVDPMLYTIDGYHAWHKLHRLVNDSFDYEDAFDINNVAEKLVTEFELEVMRNTAFFDGVCDTLRKLTDLGFELMIVSSNSSKIIRYALKRDGISDCFSHVMGRPIPFDPDRIKPSPYPLEQALKHANANKQEIWYIGDDVIDVDSARSCGIIAVGVASGKFSKAQLKERGAHHVLDHINDIFTIL